MLSGEVAAADIVPADARTTSRDQCIRIFFMIAISPRLRANTVGATALQRGGLCSTGVHENSSMQPDRIQVAWSVLVQLCFLDLGTGVPILQGDLTSGLKGKRANRLLRATDSLFLLLYHVSPAKAAGVQPNRWFLPTKSRTKSIVRSLSPRDE